MKRISLISIIVLMLGLFISAPVFAQGDQERVDLIINMIEKNLDRPITGKTSSTKLERWKSQYEMISENLDELLNEVSAFRRAGDKADMPENSSIWAAMDTRRKNFKALVEYRRLLENTRKAIKNGKINDDSDLNSYLEDGFSKVQDYISENEPLDIMSEFDINKSMERLQSKTYNVNMAQADRIINDEWMNTRAVFMLYKQMVNDLSNLQKQYSKIVAWNDGSGAQPGEAYSGTGYSGIGPITFNTIWGNSSSAWKELKVGDTVYPKVSNPRGGAGGYRYEWSVDNRVISNQPQTSYRFDTPGTHYMSVNVTDSRGRSQWQSYAYNVKGSGNFDFDIYSGDSTPSVGQTVYFSIRNARGGRTPYRYRWEVNGRFIGSGASAQYTFPSSGNYEIKVQGRDASGDTRNQSLNFNVGGGSSSRIRFSVTCSNNNPSAGQSVDYEIKDATGGNEPYRYQWRMSNGASGTDQNFTVRFAKSGNYRLTVTVIDNINRSSTRQFTYNVSGGGSSSGIKAKISVSNEKPKVGELVQFGAMSVSGGRPPYNYQWSIDGKRIDDGASATYTWRDTGNYKVTLKVSDASGSSASVHKNVQVGYTPSEKLSFGLYINTNTPDQGQVVPMRIDNLKGGYQPYRFSWEMNGREFSTSQNASYRFSNSGEYKLRVRVYDRNNNSESRQSTFNVKGSLQPLSFRIRSDESSPKAGQVVRFYAEDIKGGESPYQYTWRMNESNLGSGNSVSYRFSAGTFKLQAEVRDSRGTVTTRSLNFNVGASQSLNCNFNWSSNSPAIGQTVQFRVLGLTGGTPPYTIRWQMNGGQFGTSADSSYTFRTAGTYNLNAEVRDSAGNVKTRSNTFVVNSGGQSTGLNFGISMSNNKPAVRDRVNMSISRLSGGTPPYSATWTINGQSAGSGMSVNYTFTRAGNCTITAVVTDNSGQTKTVSRTITVGGFSIQPHIK
jgi:hypothetical protein